MGNNVIYLDHNNGIKSKPQNHKTKMKTTLTKDQQELLEFINAHNAEQEAWVAEDPDNRYSSGICDNMEWWAEDGIFTVEQFKLDSAKNLYYELKRELWGYKSYPTDATLEWLEPEIERMQKQLAEKVQEERAEEERVEAIYEEAYDNTSVSTSVLPADFVLA